MLIISTITASFVCISFIHCILDNICLYAQNSGEPLYAQVNMEKKKNRQTNVANHLGTRGQDELRTHLATGKDSWV